ncbi:SusD/RagB family nutrient-binding outer membrane lipoprotein [Aureibaculum sp. A20]|uniref:SusD/RagB family nutrient-binding outer membrane lipoprotein n=1 Tax=Aureibaculum flavum TaxID=2795986 RepID=A0ABS0WSQ6_9FLAO|nr:SusD/RagB family nutrient-binding outer membrane lipoprotein [Aureibaculum flavum]MBJ2175019.1 SusD/RagB family nutrient-binding outer membrane lipoprotein [Aureibaculum flavum]
MNNKIKNIILVLGISFIYSSCETVDFGDVNNNPNGPTAAVTSQLLTQAQKRVGGFDDNDGNSINGIATNMQGILFTQQLTEGQYPGDSRYSTLTRSYNDFFTGAIQNLNRIIELNEDAATIATAAQFGDNANQIATAKILRGYILHYMTDKWGGLPYTEGFQGIDNPQPAFDTQEEIYNIIFADLESAMSAIDPSKTGPHGDVMFSGDMNKWWLFANSLKMTMALRISDVSPALAKSKFEEVIASGVYISTNAQNLEYTYGTTDVDDSVWHDRWKEREDYVLSVTMMETLRSNLDPRLFKYAEPATAGTATNPMFPGNTDAKYVGAPNGTVNGNVPDYSFPTATIIYDVDYPTPLYTAAQMKFAMAEAAVKGWNVGGTAATVLYEEGIAASMDYWGVDAADKTAYIAAHPWTSMNDIAYQKWIALYLNGWEAWAEWRRFDYPVLVPSTNAGDPRIPVRDSYDSSVQDNNPTNYTAIITAQGADDNHTKLWWDVN